MSEETQFWGVAVERYGQGGRPTNALLEFSGITPTPENKPFRGYRVFSSRERADRFVQGQWQTLSQELIPFRFVSGIMKAWQRYSTLR